MSRGVYAIIINDEIVYIGSSKDIECRFLKHKHDLIENKNKCIKLQQAFNNRVFTIEDLEEKILFKTNDLSVNIQDKEKELIIKYNPIYNDTKVGNDGKWKLSDKSLEKLKRNTREGMKSSEIKWKIRRIGKNHTPWNKGLKGGLNGVYVPHSEESLKQQGKKMSLIHKIRKEYKLSKKDVIPHALRIRNNLLQGKQYGAYQAGPFFTPEQIKRNDEVKELLESYGIKLFCPRFDVKANTDKLTLESAKEIFYEDLIGIEKCYMIIADITDYGKGRDVGTATEIGYGYGRHIPIVLLDFSEGKKSNVMLAGLADSYIRNMQEFRDWLEGETVFHLDDEELE